MIGGVPTDIQDYKESVRTTIPTKRHTTSHTHPIHTPRTQLAPRALPNKLTVHHRNETDCIKEQRGANANVGSFECRRVDGTQTSELGG
jgi:hypothetical protein